VDATELVAEVGNWKEITLGRSLAAWIGMQAGDYAEHEKKAPGVPELKS